MTNDLTHRDWKHCKQICLYFSRQAACTVGAATATKITCTTGASTRTAMGVNVVVKVKNQGTAVPVSAKVDIVDVWSSKYSWGGGDLPKAGKIKGKLIYVLDRYLGDIRNYSNLGLIYSKWSVVFGRTILQQYKFNSKSWFYYY